MLQVQEKDLDRITELFHRILKGEIPQPLTLPADYPENEVKQVVEYANRFVVDYQALAGAIRGLAGKHSAVLLSNHGPVVSGANLEAAIYATEELEETAKLFLLLRNTPTTCLNEAQIAELKSVFKLDI